MIIRTNVKAGACPEHNCGTNHNEKLASDINTIEQKKTVGKKLRLSKETIKILKDGDLKQVAGGGNYKSTNDPTAC